LQQAGRAAARGTFWTLRHPGRREYLRITVESPCSKFDKCQISGGGNIPLD
jgi:hypothetical protein